MRKRILNRYKKFVRKYGKIIKYGKLEPDSYYVKGSYFIAFQSDIMSACIGDVDEYSCYQSLVREIKKNIVERGII